jgi:hypothetical protein
MRRLDLSRQLVRAMPMELAALGGPDRLKIRDPIAGARLLRNQLPTSRIRQILALHWPRRSVTGSDIREDAAIASVNAGSRGGLFASRRIN